MRLLVTMMLTLFASGCSTLMSWKDDTHAQTPAGTITSASTVDAKPASNKDLELKIAKLWSKVDELELQGSKQRQRISVLERGLMLGILPDELKSEFEKNAQQDKISQNEKEPVVDVPGMAEANPQHPVQVLAAEPKPKTDRAKILSDAQQFFEQGQYGRALALYSSLEEEGDGSQRYWVGLCWYKLREYETAHKEFSEFIAKYPSGAWAPRAKYHLAQINFSLGFKEKAIGQLQKIIQEYPNEDASQMARASLTQMEENL